MRNKLTLLAAMTGVALWQMAAIQPASADAVSDLQAQVTALQNKVNDLSTKGMSSVNKDYPGYWNLPGTDTWMTLAGHVKLDAEYDHKADTGPQMDYSSIPMEGAPGSDRVNKFHANTKQTYLYLDTHTPTKYGDLRAHISWDFYLSSQGNPNISNSYAFRLRNAYGVLGNWTFGQDWSTFQDVAAGPNTIDFNGPAGQTFIRQPQLRYDRTIGANQYMLALENSSPDFTSTVPFYNGNQWNVDQDGQLGDPAGCTVGRAPTCNLGPSQKATLPDIVARWENDGDYGHVSFMALARKISMDTGTAGVVANGGTVASASTWGYGFAFTGALNLNTVNKGFGNDNIVWQLAGGPGIGRYLQDLLFNGAIYNPATNTLDKLTSWGGFVGYEHFWDASGDWESNLVLGAEGTRMKDETILAANGDQMTTHSESLSLNLLWHPVSNVTFGIENSLGKRKVNFALPGQADHGYADRFQFSGIYSF
ncbi:MAG: porin [Pseudomonadota bacterium]|nr:porin [Pseudomonadota bacterium]